jgi:hypothetical protein
MPQCFTRIVTVYNFYTHDSNQYFAKHEIHVEKASQSGQSNLSGGWNTY